MVTRVLPFPSPKLRPLYFVFVFLRSFLCSTQVFCLFTSVKCWQNKKRHRCEDSHLLRPQSLSGLWASPPRPVARTWIQDSVSRPDSHSPAMLSTCLWAPCPLPLPSETGKVRVPRHGAQWGQIQASGTHGETVPLATQGKVWLVECHVKRNNYSTKVTKTTEQEQKLSALGWARHVRWGGGGWETGQDFPQSLGLSSEMLAWGQDEGPVLPPAEVSKGWLCRQFLTFF